MDKQPTERPGPGSAPGRRGSGWERRARFGLSSLALLLVAGASPTWAAQVVEVRVGRHPDFTRIVFELDRSAGYRIERSAPNAKESELIVSLEASSIPRRIQSTKSFIEQIVVEPSGSRSVARIRLARSGLKLKEMILASPPRIVLDVISEEDVASRSAAPVTKTAVATTKPAVAVVKTEAAPPPPAPMKSVAATPTTPTPATPPTKLLATTEKPGASATAPTADANAPSAATPGTPGAAPASAPPAATPGADSEAAPSEWRDGGAAEGAEAAAPGQPGTPEADQLAAAQGAATPETPRARPMRVKPSEPEADGGLMTWVLAGLGLALAAFGGLVVVRRRRAAAGDEEEIEESAASPFGGGEEADETADAGEEEESAAESTNPFAGLAGADSKLPPAPPRERPMAARVADKHEKKPSESLLFDDAEEKTMEGMEVISRSQASEGLGGPMPMMGGASDELQQMFREMQRRVAALESRIDELVDARDRLERQVAAQTEELRVQRAAIARTQRAVRNLARPEDGGEDEPTEPALRDPN